VPGRTYLRFSARKWPPFLRFVSGTATVIDSPPTPAVTDDAVHVPSALRWSVRLAARLGRMCHLLRETHEARIPF
jgi:hypothetical protein